jgi:hypothetical protein
MRISKSNYVAGVQCLKRLYLQVHDPELAAQPDASAQAVMEQGGEAGLLARQYSPVVWRSAAISGSNRQSAPRRS